MDYKELQQIDCWEIDDFINQSPELCIYKVHNKDNPKEKYFLALSQDVNSLTDENMYDYQEYDFPFILHCKPEFSYYDNHCFPLIPPSCSSGYYEGRYYFIFEKLCRSLSFLISDSSLEVTECDLAYVAYQILEILSYCFSRNKILKNIHINDFYIRRTTRGCRVILLNQDFIDGNTYFIDDPTFTSISVMSGNEPTAIDNLISISYIMLFLSSKSLPWLGLDDNDIITAKKRVSIKDFPPYLSFFSPLFSSSIDPQAFIEQALQAIHTAYPQGSLRLGFDNQTAKNKRKVSDIGIPPEPEPEPEPIHPTPTVNETPSRIVTVSGQKYEVKVVNGKRIMEPINSPVPPIRLRKKYIQVSSQKEEEKKVMTQPVEDKRVMEQEVKEEVIVQPVEEKAADQDVKEKADIQSVEEKADQDIKGKADVQQVEEKADQDVKEVNDQDIKEKADVQPVEKKKEEKAESLEEKTVESVKEAQPLSDSPLLPASLPVSQHRMKRDRSSSTISSFKEKRHRVSIKRESLSSRFTQFITSSSITNLFLVAAAAALES